ncbi:MAG: L,D-transpeptidase [Geobacteraceae bacterium]|nr:L,D-transpeptidase [Geobacteraceae bacterium]
MRTSNMRLSHRLVLVAFFAAVITGGWLTWEIDAVDPPAASPTDKAQEDLSRIEYPSQKGMRWHPHFVLPNETLESLYGNDWVWVARFNRVDRRHVYPGMTIKEPDRMEDIRGYTPLPKEYEPAREHDKYILVDKTEQWIGAYEHGKLKFSMPAATGKPGTETPTGMFRIDARHLTHTSSLYKIDGEEGDQYPMDNALRFYIDEKNVGYWIHARDLPGRPASHGCIGLFDEEMQQRVFDSPRHPVLLDSQKLYEWAVPDSDYGDDYGEAEEIEGGPVVEVRGDLPRYR